MTNALCSTNIEFSDKESLLSEINNLQGQLLVILSETGAVRYGIHFAIMSLVEQKNAIWIKDKFSYPNQKIIRSVLEKIGTNKPKTIVAIGGGSAIDLAKVVKAFYNEGSPITEDEITDILVKNAYYSNDMDIFAVPTTSGTGSEVTQWATVWDVNRQRKFSVDAMDLKPDYTRIVPEFMIYMGKELTISTGLDSIAHAIEAYWSKATNPLVRALSIHSLRISVAILEKVIACPENVDYREKQALAALLSGIAFSMTRTTACHSISYPLTMDYGIPHGIAVAMTLSDIYEINKGCMVDVKDLDEVFADYYGIDSFIEEICSKANISLRLSDYGLNKDDLETIVRKSFTLGRMDNNPTSVEPQNVRSILLKRL